jgi:hypothetical protein
VATHDGLVLLSIAFCQFSGGFPEYYIYRPGGAGADDHPSLDLIPQPSNKRLVDRRWTAGFLSCSHGGGGYQYHYHIAALAKSMQAKGVFDLHVFSSKTGIWTVRNPTVASLPEADAAAIDFDGYIFFPIKSALLLKSLSIHSASA